MSTNKPEKKRKKNQSFGEKLFSRFAKKKKDKDKDKHSKQNKKDNKKNGKVNSQKRHSKHEKKQSSKPNKIIDVRPAEPAELKEIYTISDVINYRSQVIRSVNDEKRKNLVIEKLRLCSVRFDFTQIMDEHKMSINAQQQQLNGNNANNGNNPNNKKDKANIDGIPHSSSLRISRTLSNTKEDIEKREQLTIGIDKKRQMLVEIVEFISTQKWWDEDILKELINCVRSNLFRTLPLGSKRKFVKGDEEEEPFLDPQWLHLQLVYELCLRFLISNDIDKKVMQKYLHGSFVLNLIQLFQSEDLRERDYLKTILHRIYGRFMPLRAQIRTEIANECYRYVYGVSRAVHGIAEFLDIFSSIINGFSIPVKEEHKAFLRNVLLPLHKCDKYEVYFQQLADCCVLFVNKEQSIATTVLGGLLKFWPKLSPTKQAFYLREMLNVIGALVEHENGFSYPKYKDIVLLCVDKIFQCMESPHFQVADQALSLWKDTVMLYLSKCQKDMIWRRLFIIFKNIQLNHWNPGIKQLTNEVVLYYERIDFQYWKKLKDEYEENSNNNTSYTNGEIDNNNDNSSGNIPKTLVPEKYQNEKKYKIQQRQKQRVTKWKLIREAAQENKEIFDKKQEEMNGYNTTTTTTTETAENENKQKDDKKEEESTKNEINGNYDDDTQDKTDKNDEIDNNESIENKDITTNDAIIEQKEEETDKNEENGYNDEQKQNNTENTENTENIENTENADNIDPKPEEATTSVDNIDTNNNDNTSNEETT